CRIERTCSLPRAVRSRADSAFQSRERRADQAAANDLELTGDLLGQLARLGPAGGVPAPGDRNEGALDEPELAFRRGPEPAQVARLDAGTLQFDERTEHREDGLSVELGRDDERGRHRVVEQLRGRAGLAD